MQVQKLPPRSRSGSFVSAHRGSKARASCRAGPHSSGGGCLGPWPLCHSSCQGACSQLSLAQLECSSAVRDCMAAQTLWTIYCCIACSHLVVDRAADTMGLSHKAI